MTTLALVARLLLALVFVISAVSKLRDGAAWRTAVQDFGVPAPVVRPVAAVLPYLELACAVLLVCADPAATVGAVAALVLLTAFTLAIVANLLLGRRPDCHCFGAVGDGGISWRTVARNAALLVLAALSLTHTGSIASVPSALRGYRAGQVAAGALFALLAAAVLVLALALRTLMGRYGAVLLRLEALEIATGTAPPRPAPAFALPDLDGQVVSLQDALDEGRPVLVAFLSPTCTLCSDLVPLLAAWQQEPGHPVTVVALSTGTAEANRDKLAGAPLQVLLQEEDELTQAYGVQGTPAAFLLGVDGLIAAPPAHGLDAVVALHDAALRTLGDAHAHDGPEVHQIGQRPLAVGDVLPELVVGTDDGQVAALAEVTATPSVLLFWRTDCGFCAGILDDVVALQDSAPLLLVSGTPGGTLRASGLTVPVLREQDGAVSQALRVPGTPAAVLVREGVVQSPVAVGGPDVIALIQRSVRAPSLAAT